ncbi:antibiotic biosynthesis monooxygenase family protein [Curtobacterium pusillum]|uniref:antibiotic biosynthesis monooxygenase family protein n=1 Tax=Curtobacterium pusillum TaxID=69373 RepID=UPI0015FC1507|nr:antibiotic biosynthesis monooxygenase family protein [Curtobacterium pusillum]
MTYVNAGTLGTLPGKRDELVSRLTQRNDRLRELGCTAYEVGVNEDEPETVFVVELWESAAAAPVVVSSRTSRCCGCEKSNTTTPRAAPALQ